MDTSPAILVTGFEPFASDTANSSWDVARALAARWEPAIEGARIETALLPVSFAKAPQVIDAAVARTGPSLILHLGLAGGTERVAIERVALNLADARIPDNDGDQPIDRRLDGGPDARFATIPVKAALSACLEREFPAEISLSAGTFVCNAVMYHSLSRATAQKVGFIHLPRANEHAEGSPSLPLEVMVGAVHTIARTCMHHEGPDRRIVGGALD